MLGELNSFNHRTIQVQCDTNEEKFPTAVNLWWCSEFFLFHRTNSESFQHQEAVLVDTALWLECDARHLPATILPRGSSHTCLIPNILGIQACHIYIDLEHTVSHPIMISLSPGGWRMELTNLSRITPGFFIPVVNAGQRFNFKGSP